MSNSQQQAPSFEEIRRILKETSLQMKETDRKIKETSLQMKETDRKVKENSQGIKELRESQKQTDRQMKETDKKIAKLERTIDKIGSGFNERWGRFVESLVEGKLSKLLRERGIQVLHTSPNVKRDILNEKGEVIGQKEFDIIVVNGKEVVLVEVKTTLSQKSIQQFLDQYLKDFKSYFPDHKKRVLYGAVAYLKSEDKAISFAEEQGLFVIKATGDSAHIINKTNFKPKAFP